MEPCASLSEGLEAVVDHLCTVTDRGSRWQLTIEQLAALTARDQLDWLHRNYRLYRLRRSDGVLPVFDPASVGQLVGLLEEHYPNAERAFSHAGLFLPVAHRIGIHATYVEHCLQAQRDHTADAEQFRAMLRAFRRFQDAARVYLDTFFPRAPTIGVVAEHYQTTAGLAARSRAIIRDYLEEAWQRHVFSEASVFGPLLAQLHRLAAPGDRDQGFSSHGSARRRAPGGNGAAHADPAAPVPPQIAAALRELAQPVAPLHLIDRQSLRDHYRQMVRRYHPDVNPDGLERTKSLTAAFALVMFEITQFENRATDARS